METVILVVAIAVAAAVAARFCFFKRRHSKKDDGDVHSGGAAAAHWQPVVDVDQSDRVRRRGTAEMPDAGRAYAGGFASPPPVPLFVNAKQQKIIMGGPRVSAVSLKQPPPAVADLIVKPAAVVAPPESAQPSKVMVMYEEDEDSPRAYGRTQFVQVFHNTPLVKPKGDAPTAMKRKPSRLDKDLASSASEAAVVPPALPPPVKEARMPTLNFEIPFESIRLGELIGQGAFGRVHKGSWRGTPVAVKVLVCQILSAEVVDEFRGEITVLSALRHPNVVLFMGAVTVAPNFCIITELVSRGSLWSVLHSSTPLDWPICLKMAIDVCRGMAFLHSAVPAILHRDLKSGNLLVDEAFNIKLTDFGLARVKAYTQTMTGSCGTYQWMAPEVLGNMRYTEKADVYSFAVVCWELLTRQCPFDGMNQIQMAIGVLHHGLRETIPPGSNPVFASLIQRCWHHDPACRPPFTEVLDELEALQSSMLLRK